uniref:Helix-turn-helix type 11 domain protein n=1 Tax=Cyanothece sp. (strain PCC 7425 / ATCC 29141) TaxID=395961 RepID=B8HWI4_CYAP4
MSRHLERLLALDACLRSGQRHTAQSLASELEVCERTIRNDLAFLRDRYHAPLEFDQRRGYRYLDPTWRLPTINLSQGELFALTLGARMLETYGGSAYVRELRSAIARLAERLPEQTWVDLQQVADERILFRAGAETALDPEVWHQLEGACRHNKTVAMTYYTASRDAVSERKLDPYVLHIYRGTNPYVIGFCHKRQEILWFRADRIRKLQVLEQIFVPDPNFDIKEHLERIFQYEVGGESRPVAIWFDQRTAPFIRERRWHSTQEIQEHPDGSLTLQMNVRGMNDLKRWVLGYGSGAVVKHPPDLVEMVETEVQRMALSYKPKKDKQEHNREEQ